MLDDANTGFQLLRWFYNRFFQPTFLHCSPKIKLSFFFDGIQNRNNIFKHLALMLLQIQFRHRQCRSCEYAYYSLSFTYENTKIVPPSLDVLHCYMQHKWMIVIPPWGKSIINSETKATEYTKSYSFIYQRKKTGWSIYLLPEERPFWHKCNCYA